MISTVAIPKDKHAQGIALARRRESQRGYRVRQSSDAPDSYSIGANLMNALINARDSVEKIPEEIGKLQALLEKEIAAGDKSEEWLEGRRYQIWLVETQLRRASDLAIQRIDYLSKFKTKEDVEKELALCERDKAHWFKYYAWGYDPRSDAPLNIIPFELFDFQIRFVEWLDLLVFGTRQSGVVPKSRDMGATETGVRWGVHNWLFRTGFEMLLLSKVEQEVDSGKDINTLFEKIRFQLRLLPDWMIPKGFSLDRDMPYMRITNPVTKSTFHGRAPTKSVGRQLRVTVVWFDEVAFVEGGGNMQATSLSQTTKSLIGVSSVAGKQNWFAEKIEDGRTPQFEMDWREHPFKTKAWYDALRTGVFGTVMTEQMIAQEIDRDLDASQPSKVFKLQEPFVFITEREFVSAFEPFGFHERFYDERKKFRIPRDWNWSRYFDYGQTKGHEWAYLIAARPTDYYPLNDTIFIFLALELQPTGLTENQAVDLWRGYEEDLGLRDGGDEFINPPFDSLCSHEQKSLRETLSTVYGEEWAAWNTDYVSGITQAQSWFEVIEKTLPNPYRPKLSGRTKVVCVAPNDADGNPQYQLAFNSRDGKYYVTTSKDEAGFKTFRKQLGAYHYPESERGKDVKKMRPAKFFDDIIDTFRALAVNWGVPAKEKTDREEIESRMPAQLKTGAIAQNYGGENFGSMVVARHQEERRIRAEIDEERETADENLQKMMSGATGGKRLNLFGRRRNR